MAVKRALISVSDKTGVVDLAQGLVQLGWEIVSTGGTAGILKEAGISVKEVSSITGFPEILSGRVKTLHPMVHGGILARRDNPGHMEQLEKQGIPPIDLVAVNLYPFEKATADPDVDWETAMENIDIGGVALIRAAAKNHRDVIVLTSPDQYDSVLKDLTSKGVLGLEMRRQLALEAFGHTARYDTAIRDWFRQQIGSQ